ncbi:MAG: tetratricopeptide repeat-containing sensor histidine kinase [Cyclobacteriaceae bacterium]
MRGAVFILLIVSLFEGWAQQNKSEIETIDQRGWIEELLVLSEENVYAAPEKALSYSEEALKIAEVLEDDPLRAKSLNRIGVAYWSLGKLDVSMTFLNESMVLAETLEDSDLAARNLGNLGNVFGSADLKASSIELYKSALAIFKKRGNTNRVFVFNNNIGKAFMDGNELDSATKYFNEANIFLVDQPTSYRPIFYFNLGELAFKKRDIQTADSLMDISLREAIEQNDLRAICRNKQLKSEIFMLKEQPDEALALANEAYEIASKTKVKDLMMITTKTLSKAYAVNDSFEEAFSFAKLSDQYKDSLQNTVVKNQLMVFKNQQEQRELELLKTKTTFAQQRTVLFQTVVVGLVLVLLIVGLLFFLLWKNNKKLNNKNEEVEELSEFKTKMLAIVSHDIRAPAAALYSTISVIEENTHDTALLSSVIPKIKKKTKAALDLMDSLIVWAKSPVEGVTVNKRNVQVRPIIDEMIEHFSEDLNEKDLTLEIEVEDDEFVITDPNLLRVIVRNFVSNAIKFSYEGGIITIFSLIIYGKYKLIVKDEGMGLSTEQIEVLFSDDQIKTKGTNEEAGSGLGLRICKSFAEMLDGEINVRSEQGQGADFSLAIPV